MKFAIAKKVNMTQIFGEDGAVQPVTVLAVEKAVVSQIKTKEIDGYDAVQVAAGVGREKNINKAQRGHLKGLNLAEKTGLKIMKEFKGSPELKKGDEIAFDFAVGDEVEVTGISKGKGFQGVVKRHGFAGGPRSHGQKHSEREPGSIGGSGGRAGGRVAKGMRMAGRMGSDRITVKNLKVAAVDAENGVMMISGAVPGRRGTILEIRSN